MADPNPGDPEFAKVQYAHWQEGQKAGLAGKTMSDNPHPVTTRAWLSWAQGCVAGLHAKAIEDDEL